jgi:hypothetical protein
MMTILLWLFNYIPTFFLYIGLSFGVVLYLFAEMSTFNIAKYVKSSYLTPSLVRIVGVVMMALSLFLLGVSYSDKAFKVELEKKNDEIARINENAKEITKDVVVKYVYRDKIIKEKGDEIVKYITTKNDADCRLHSSTIELLNASAKNNLPDPTRATDESSAGVDLSTVTRAVTENNEKYHQVANQLISLQEWVKEQQKNNK